MNINNITIKNNIVINIGSPPRANISFFLLSICIDEPLFTPKIINFLPQSKSEYKKESTRIKFNTISQIRIFVWIGIFSNLTAPKKHSFRLKSAFKSCDYLFNSKIENKFILYYVFCSKCTD